MFRLPLLTLGLTTLALSGCGDEGLGKESAPTQPTVEGDADTDADADTDTDTDPPAEATLTLTSPADGSRMDGDTVTLTWEVENFLLDAAAIGGTTNVPGSGHVHVYDSYGGTDTYVDATADTSYTLYGLASGPHTFTIRLSENNHAELDISASVTVELVSPSVVITSPSSGTVVDASSVELELQIGDFTVNPTVGGAAVDGEGHYHLSVDGVYFDYGTDPTSAWVTRLTPGDHEIKVELVGNDHLPIGVETSVPVTVSADAIGVSLNTSTYVGAYDSATWPVEVTTTNWTLTESSLSDSTVVPGEGHYHIYVDGVYYEANYQALAYALHQPAGDHVLAVHLADATHAEYARDYVRVSCEADRPDVTITSPPAGEIVTAGSDVRLEVSVENFSLVDFNLGRPNAQEEGHLHVDVDGGYYGAFYESTTTIVGLTAGTHTIDVGLYNNDHSERSPVVFDTLTVEVQ